MILEFLQQSRLLCFNLLLGMTGAVSRFTVKSYTPQNRRTQSCKAKKGNNSMCNSEVSSQDLMLRYITYLTYVLFYLVILIFHLFVHLQAL